MKTGQLYIAFSDDLLEWAQEEGQLFLFKIGTTSDPELRLRALNEGWPGKSDSGPCLNCTDWRWAVRWHYRARAVANADEEQLKDFLEERWRVFDRHAYPRFASARENGATEVYQIREDELYQVEELSTLLGQHRNDVLKAGVVAAIVEHIRVELQTLFPAVADPDDFEEDESMEDLWEPEEPEEDDTEEERHREFSDQLQDLLSDQDDHERSDQDGWLYKDD